MTEDVKRPEWKYDIPLKTFREISGMNVKIIEHVWVQTGVDTSDHWLIFRDGTKKIQVKGPAFWKYFKFETNHWARLIGLTYLGEEAQKQSIAISTYDKKHNAELATYKRLKKKFEGVDID